MTEAELKQAQKEGKVEVVGELPQNTAPVTTGGDLPQPEVPFNVQDYVVLLEAMNKPRRHITAAPTFVPGNFADQIQFYDDGVARRLYLYINGTWRYVALT